MDEQLKRRLMGATIVTALAVIFVPMLFEDKSAAPAGGSTAEIPALPEAIEQRAIELPKSADDVAPAEGSESKEAKRAPETGYRIVPLDDAPPKPAKPTPVPEETATPGAQAGLEGEDEGEILDDEGGEAPVEKPAAPAPKAAVVPKKTLTAKTPAGKKAKPGAGEGTASAARASDAEGDEPFPVIGDEAEPPAAPAKPKAAQTPAKPAEPSAKKPKAAIAAPAKPTAKPEPAESPAAKSASLRPVAESEPADVGGDEAPLAKPAPAKAAAPKAAPAATTKPKEPVQAVEAPSSWVVQAGSFTAEANARALADKLRKQNLPASVHVSHRESGDVYRVTLGPELNRTRAEQMLKQVESAAGIKGMILPHH